MSIFENSFFSIAGQLERLGNVKNTLIAAVTGKGVKSNTGINAVDKVLSTAASNPFTTAAAVSVAVNPVGAINAAKSVFTALPTSAKAVSILATPVVVGAVVQNPQIAVEAAKTPSKLANFGSNASALLANPSVDNLKTLVKENPLISTGAALAGTAAVGGGLGLAANTAATYLNSRATNKNTQTAEIGIPSGVDPMEYMKNWMANQQQTNKQDVDIAEIQFKAQKEANETALEIAKLQAQQSNLSTTPTAAPLQPSKVVKKTTKKKKKATPKKKTKAKKTKKKAKTIKRKKKKR